MAKLLGDRIAGGHYQAGEYLPPERRLAAELRVSRQTVRLALRLLERERLIEQEERRGNRVLPLPLAEAPRRTGLAALVIYEMARGGAAAIFRGCQLALRRAGYH